MPNLRIVSRNLADTATLTASSEASADTAVANLKTNKKGDVWRAIGTYAELRAAWTAAQTVGFVGLLFCDLSDTAMVRVRVSNEASETNLLQSSERFDRSPWFKTRCYTQRSDEVQAPDGSRTATKLYNNGVVDSSGYLKQSFTADGSVYLASVFVKAAELAAIQIDFVENNGANFVANARTVVNPATGQITTAGNQYSAIYSMGSGWYRIVVGGAPAAGTGEFRISLQNDATSGMDGVYIWGAMVTKGTVLSSYYPSVDTFTSRSTVAWYIGSAGSLVSAAGNEGRLQYNPADLSIAPKLLLEAQATNYITNNTMQGAVVGTPGTAPNGWFFSTSIDGVSFRVAAVGVENGVEYFDLAASGTVTAGNSAGAVTCENAVIAAASGDGWSLSVYMKLVSGSLAGMSSVAVNILTKKADSTTAENLLGASLTGTALATLSRQSLSRVLADANTASVQPRIRLVTGTAGQAVNFTLRIGLPQLEKAASVSSPIKTTNAAVTRAADVSTSAAGVRPAGYIDYWQAYQYDSGWVSARTVKAELEGFTDAQAAIAYAYGGGAYATHWFPKMSARGVAVDIKDPANLQGAVEAGRMVIADYFEAQYNADYGASVTAADSTKQYELESGDQGIERGTKRRVLSLQLSHLTEADRAAVFRIQRSVGLAHPVFASLFPGHADLALENDHQVFGRFSDIAAMSIPGYERYATSLPIKEI